MNRLISKSLLVLTSVFLLSAVVCSSAPEVKYPAGFREIPGSIPQKKKTKVKKPMNARQAQKQADTKDKQRKKESSRYIEENRKRSIEIQTPEVQERMKQNIKDSNARYKSKKKSNTSRCKKASIKYK